MPAFWLTYKPLGPSSPRGWATEKLSDLVRRFQIDPFKTTILWRIASHKAAQVGDRVYLFKQGNDPRGVFGIGEIIEPPALQPDPSDEDYEYVHRAKIRFRTLVDPLQRFLADLGTIEGIVPKTLIDAAASGQGVPEVVAAELDRYFSPILRQPPQISGEQADDAAFDPDSVSDERERALRAIRIRRGQPAFRSALMEAYGRRCAITACAVEDVLEAAHITPYLGKLTNQVSNGLLLRTDIHTLFDCGLLGVEPSTRAIVVAKALEKSSYGSLAGRKLRAPSDEKCGPSRRNLEKRFELFMSAQAGLRPPESE